MVSLEYTGSRTQSRSELKKMDHSLLIFDSGDEMIFTPEPSATNIHFRIHRPAGEAVTVSEEDYQILNNLFGTPAYSPDPAEDTRASGLSTPKMVLPEFLKDTEELEPRNVFETLFSDQLEPIPENEFSKDVTVEPELSFAEVGPEIGPEEMEQRNVSEMVLPDQLTPSPESWYEFSEDLTMETSPSPKPLTPSRPTELLDKSEELEGRNVSPKTIFCDQLTAVPEIPDYSSSSEEDVQINEKKHSPPLKRGISAEEDGRKVKKTSVSEWNLSNIFTKSKSQSAFKSEKKRKMGKKKVSSKCISTHQSPRINKFVSQIQSNTQRHMTIKKFAEDHFSVFTESILSKMDDLTKEITFCHQNIKKMQESIDEFKLLKCKCKRRSSRYSVL